MQFDENRKHEVEKMLSDLQNLREQSDASCEEPFCEFHSDVSVCASQSSQSAAMRQTLKEICRKETHSEWASNGNGCDSVNSELKELKETNRRLREDNSALVTECLRLRKIIKENGIDGSVPKPSNCDSKIEKGPTALGVSFAELANLESLNQQTRREALSL